MAADDDTLKAIVRRYRLAAKAILAGTEQRILLPWQRDDFGMSSSAWTKWARENPTVIALGPPKKFQAGTWEQLKLFVEEEQLSLWSQRALAEAENAQYRTALATQRFLDEYNRAAREGKGARLPVPIPMPPSDYTTEKLRDGAAGVEVWRRPLSTFRIELGQGKPVGEARTLAAQRARTILGTNTQLAHVRASVNYMRERGDRNKIVGYRRDPRGAASCALCLLASTQRYHRGDLMPIHDHCHCVTVPIYGDREPPQVIEPERLAGVHARIEAETGSADLSGGHYRDAVIIHHHGELGPVLSYREHSFTGPSDLQSSN